MSLPSAEAIEHIADFFLEWFLAPSFKFSPKVFGINTDKKDKINKIIFLTLGIICVAVIVAQIHRLGLISYLVYAYIIYTTARLIMSKSIK